MKWKNAPYSQDDLAAMQKDAMERVREMQRRADETLRRSNSSLQKPRPPQPPQPNQSPPAAPQDPQQQLAPGPLPPAAPPSGTVPVEGKVEQLLQTLGIDRDRLLILGLLFLLYNEGNSDYSLLLALLYLLF